MDVMDEKIKEVLRGGMRKRKADDGEERREQFERAKKRVAERVPVEDKFESAKKRVTDQVMTEPGRFEQAKKRVAERYMAGDDRGEGSSRPAPANRTKQSAINSTPPTGEKRVIDRKLAGKDPKKFLRDAFFDEHGKDAGWEPVELKGLDSWERCQLHQAAGSLKLYHETTVTSVMIIGSGKNTQGQKRLKELDRAAGWPPEPYVPNIDAEEDENGEESEQEGEVTDDNEDSDPDEEREEEEPAEWDITGIWELKCPGMAGCFGQYAPYTLEIFSTPRRVGWETYGRFDLGQYKGVFRFSSQKKDPRGLGDICKDDIEEFLLDKEDMPSAENPTIFYRWRGKEDGEGVIQLRSENYLYEMTFSDGGRRVTGTWGSHDADPGTVKFSGVKTSYHGVYRGMNIQFEWGNLDEAAYDQANRDRWRRRY